MKWISLAPCVALVAASAAIEYRDSRHSAHGSQELAPVASAVNPLGPKAIGGTYEDSTCGMLRLNPDGSYSASESGQCGVPYGDAAGRWSATKTTLTLTPSTEHGTMRDGLRTLDIVDLGERLILLRPSDRVLFKQSGIKRVSCFQREDQFVDNDLIGLFVRGHSDKQLR
jgi:hypothetical protein